MAKCSKCSTRKAKRDCPALFREICPQCCADGRLRDIACPPACPHLQSEHYQHQRRKERAASRGREFVETTRRLFPSEPASDFAFKVQADIYYFLRNESPVDDAGVARAIEALGEPSGRIVLPSASLPPLERFLRERLGDRSRYPSEGALEPEGRARALRDLARHVASLGGTGTFRYRDLLASFFDALDFEADLDYSPRDASGQEGTEAPRSPGGLILPPSIQPAARGS